MPTPMPIIEATSGVKSGVEKTCAMTPTPATAMPTPTSAVRIGRPIATTEPNASRSTTTAARMPMSSVAGIDPSVNESPPNATGTPSCRSGSASASTRCAACSGSSRSPSASVMGAIAMRPPGDTCSGSTAVTPGSARTWAR